MVPCTVSALQGKTVVKIDSLSTHSVAVTSDGALYTWGNGDKNRLGHGGTGKEYAPRLVAALQGRPPVSDVACGLGHTLVLLSSGQVVPSAHCARMRTCTHAHMRACTAEVYTCRE